MQFCRLETLALLICAAIFFGTFAVFGGGPITWDEMLYLYYSYHPQPAGFILNRYAHIYLQMPFVALAGDAFIGARIFWAFIVTCTLAMTYFSAKFLYAESSKLAGVFAVLFLLAQGGIFQLAGVTYADFTTMFWVTLAVFLWISTHRLGRPARRTLTAALVLVFYLAVRSKETGIFLAPLIVGLLVEAPDGRGKWTTAAYFAVGLMVGVGLIVIADSLFLRDALFSLRPGSWRNLLAYNLRDWPRSAANWFGYITSGDLLFPFVLYLLAGRELLRNADDWGLYWVWLIPFWAMGFLSMTLVVGAFGVIARHVVPMIPVVCICAAQLLRGCSSVRASHEGRSGAMGRSFPRLPAVLLGAAIAYFALFAVNLIAAEYQWNREAIFEAAIAPLTAVIAAAVLVYPKKGGRLRCILLFAAAWGALFHPLLTNVKTLAERTTYHSFERRFSPFRVYANQITVDRETTVTVTNAVFDKTGMLGRDYASLYLMFNLYFRARLSPQRFEWVALRDALKARPTYLFCLCEELENVDHDSLRGYEILHGGDAPVCLLRKKEG